MTVTPIYFDSRYYRIEVMWQPSSNGYVGIVVDIPQVAGWALTAGGAAEEAQKALRTWIIQQKSLGNGELIPYPSRSEFADAYTPQPKRA